MSPDDLLADLRRRGAVGSGEGYQMSMSLIG